MPAGAKPPPGGLTQEVGAIVRARMVRRNATLDDVAVVASTSRSQMSKMLRGRAHIDIEQFDAVCDELELDAPQVLAEAKAEMIKRSLVETAKPHEAGGSNDLQLDEIGRRLRLLVDHIADGDVVAGLRQVLPALARADVQLSSHEWALAVGGEKQLSQRTLSAIADGMGVPAGYLTREDAELAERVEAEFLLTQAMAEAGATRVAARGGLSSEALREIAALVSRRISKQ